MAKNWDLWLLGGLLFLQHLFLWRLYREVLRNAEATLKRVEETSRWWDQPLVGPTVSESIRVRDEDGC